MVRGLCSPRPQSEPKAVHARQSPGPGAGIYDAIPTTRVLKVGLDPHFSYANMLCDIAWARNHGTGSFMLPEITLVATMSATERLAESLPGLSLRGLGIVGSVPSGVCGRCTAFQNGRCTERGFSVVSTDPGCPLFVPVPA
jgi:hypothetical protein